MAKTTRQIVAENKRRRAREREAGYQRNRQSVRTRKEEEAAEGRRSPASSSGKQTSGKGQQDLWTNQTNRLEEAREKKRNGEYEEITDQIRQKDQELTQKYGARHFPIGSIYLTGGSTPSVDNGHYNLADQPYIKDWKEQDDLFREKYRMDYVDKYTGKDYKDNFWGQSHANYDMGRLSQDSSMAWNAYLDNPTEENRRQAETMDQLMMEIQKNNQDVYADDGTLPWLSKTLASYIPQFIDQTGYKIGGGLAGGAAGLVIAGPVGAKNGAKAGAVGGSGVYSYKTMRGAAFKNLLSAGYPEETARAAANDEAVISSIIEMGDTALDLFAKGGGKLIDTVSPGAMDAIQGQIIKAAGKNNFTKLVTGLGKYGINVGGESLEEGLQECVSIANLKNPGAGKWQLTKDAAGILWDVITNPESEYREQVFGAAKEGGKIASVLGGGEIVANSALTNAAANYQVGQIYGQDPQALIQESRELNPNSALAKKLQESLDNGKKISGGDLKRLVLENERAIANMEDSSVESSAEEQPNEAGSPKRNGWRNADAYARQGDLNAVEAMDRAGLFGSADLARANPQVYGHAFQEALKGGASYDQALIRATSDTVMKLVGGQGPMGEVLFSLGGDPNKAVSLIRDATAKAGINMTPGELKLLGIVAAEASAYQLDPSFQREVAFEMLKENSQEKAWTVAGEKLWGEATDRAIRHGVANWDLEGKGGEYQQTADAIDELSSMPNVSDRSTDVTLIGIDKEATSEDRIHSQKLQQEFTEFKKVLGEYAPETLEDFEELKYNDPEQWEKLKTMKEQTAFVENARCITTPKKFIEYFLRPGADHGDHFLEVGYTQDDVLRLRYEIAKQFDMEKAVEYKTYDNGAVRFNIYMQLGVTEKKRFLTGWFIDKPGDTPRIVTGFRKDRE